MRHAKTSNAAKPSASRDRLLSPGLRRLPRPKGEGDGAGRDRRPGFLALVSDQVLRRIIITGRPDWECPTTPRPMAGTTISTAVSAEIDDLVAYFDTSAGGACRRPDATVPSAGFAISSLAATDASAN